MYIGLAVINVFASMATSHFIGPWPATIIHGMLGLFFGLEVGYRWND
jgi:hypothetical protein